MCSVKKLLEATTFNSVKLLQKIASLNVSTFVWLLFVGRDYYDIALII